MKFLLLTSILFFVPSVLLAEVNNTPGRFDEITPCPAYFDFLDGGDPDKIDGCHSIAKFIIQAKDLSPTEFMKEYQNNTKNNTALRYLVNTQQAVIYGYAQRAYLLADLADRQIFYDLTRAHDDERAALYSSLLSGVKAQAIRTVCPVEAECSEMTRFLEPSKIVGSAFSHLDDFQSHWIIYCLLRTDGYEVPIREVLSSQAFPECLLHRSKNE